jgi:phosphotransferase system HPr (HPr) family protein
MARETVELEVRNAHGLHARPAALFVQTAARFSSDVRLKNLGKSGRELNAKSIMEVLTAGVDQGTHIELIAEGDDAGQAIAALRELIESGLGDA